MEDRIESGVYVRPCDGETLSGDVALVKPQENGVFAALIDALGHGPDAHRLGVRLGDALAAKRCNCVLTGKPLSALKEGSMTG